LTCNHSIKGLISSKLIGAYNFENILAAICIGDYFGVSSNDIDRSIGEYAPDNSRSQVVLKGSNTIILDAYNANPSSMEAALKNFSERKGISKIVFLGEMAELGPESEHEHKQLIELLGQLKFENIILVGEKFSSLDSKFPARYFKDSIQARDWARQQHFSESEILIKGSRSSRMEAVLEAL